MKLIFLGTSSGMPTKERNVSGLALQATPGRWYLVDCGEGTQYQLLRHDLGLSLVSLAGIFITHVHGDHCYGLPGLLASATNQGRSQPLRLVAPLSVWQMLQPILAFSEMRLGYEIQFVDVNALEHETWHDVQVSAIPLSHRVPSYGYYFVHTPWPPSPKLDQTKLLAAGVPPSPIWGDLQRGRDVTLPDGRVLVAHEYQLPVPDLLPQRVIIGGDNDKPALIAPYAADLDVLVHEATFTQAIGDKVGPTPQHSTAAQVAKFAEQVQIPNLILTHFSARYDRYAVQEIATEAAEFYHGQLFLAEDLAVFELDMAKVLRRIATDAELK